MKGTLIQIICDECGGSLYTRLTVGEILRVKFCEQCRKRLIKELANEKGRETYEGTDSYPSDYSGDPEAHVVAERDKSAPPSV